ncbi:unnamed protein product [Bubo scandiacus]
MPCVHYKFSSLLHYDTVTFSGLHISLGDLKRHIMGRQKLKVTNCELQISNAQTGEGAWGRRARGLGHCPAGSGRGLREPHSALSIPWMGLPLPGAGLTQTIFPSRSLMRTTGTLSPTTTRGSFD